MQLTIKDIGAELHDEGMLVYVELTHDDMDDNTINHSFLQEDVVHTFLSRIGDAPMPSRMRRQYVIHTDPDLLRRLPRLVDKRSRGTGVSNWDRFWFMVSPKLKRFRNRGISILWPSVVIKGLEEQQQRHQSRFDRYQQADNDTKTREFWRINNEQVELDDKLAKARLCEAGWGMLKWIGYTVTGFAVGALAFVELFNRCGSG